jgi:carbamoyl-phosphate synthase small subunit
MLREFDRKLITEDGTEYPGFGFGAVKDVVLELVFNTSPVGYQEILSDPSYTDQAVVMTYPLIGNYGMCADDYETETPTIGALIVREYNGEPSNFRAEESLGSVMARYGIPGISGLDTRKLNRSIRDLGSRKALLTSVSTPLEEGLSIIKSTALQKDAVARVSSKEIKTYTAEDFGLQSLRNDTGGIAPKVVLIDCGAKLNILRSLLARSCQVTVVPWNTDAETILSLEPDGVMLSNGPGDPTDVPETIATVKALIGKLPIFGICLGHQILSLAYGAKTYKLKFGHRGGNHPVRDLLTGRIEITSQNHSYAVDEASLTGTGLSVTHRNILDNTVEGVSCIEDLAFSVQYHPESSPGPQDSTYLFDRFLNYMEAQYAEAD